MSGFLLGASGTLSVAFVVAVVALAFKNKNAYWRLCLVLFGILAMCAAGYVGYALGSLDGGRKAVEQIEAGTSIADVSTGMPGWPLLIMMAIFSALITLSWFPEFLGIDNKGESKERG